jgi:hypothetical protein
MAKSSAPNPPLELPLRAAIRPCCMDRVPTPTSPPAPRAYSCSLAGAVPRANPPRPIQEFLLPAEIAKLRGCGAQKCLKSLQNPTPGCHTAICTDTPRAEATRPDLQHQQEESLFNFVPDVGSYSRRGKRSLKCSTRSPNERLQLPRTTFGSPWCSRISFRSTQSAR